MIWRSLIDILHKCRSWKTFTIVRYTFYLLQKKSYMKVLTRILTMMKTLKTHFPTNKHSYISSLTCLIEIKLFRPGSLTLWRYNKQIYGLRYNVQYRNSNVFSITFTSLPINLNHIKDLRKLTTSIKAFLWNRRQTCGRFA